jgi:hypothetical protein
VRQTRESRVEIEQVRGVAVESASVTENGAEATSAKIAVAIGTAMPGPIERMKNSMCG